MDPEQKPPDFWKDSSSDVAVVDPADLTVVWELMQDVQRRNEGQSASVGIAAYKNLCSPGANVEAVWFRAAMLGMLNMAMPGWMGNADVGRVMKIAASFPMKKVEVGVAFDGPPFDLPEFLKQVGLKPTPGSTNS
jgi:hypothetical protein